MLHKASNIPFVQSDIKLFSIAQGQFDYTTMNLFNNAISFRVRICLIKLEALSLNPLNLITTDVSNMDLVWDDSTARSLPFSQTLTKSVTLKAILATMRLIIPMIHGREMTYTYKAMSKGLVCGL